MASDKTTKPLYTKGEDDKMETLMKALIKKGKKLTADQKAELLAQQDMAEHRGPLQAG